MQVRHQNYDVIVAWAEGKDIQFRHKTFSNDDEWQDWKTLIINDRVSGIPDFSNSSLIWRIKPAKAVHKYRVALVYGTRSKTFKTFTLDYGQMTEKAFADKWDIGYTRFVRWLTDWIEGQIP